MVKITLPNTGLTLSSGKLLHTALGGVHLYDRTLIKWLAAIGFIGGDLKLFNVSPPVCPSVRLSLRPNLIIFLLSQRYNSGLTGFEPSHEKTNIVRQVSTRISLSMPRRLTQTDTFRLLWFLSASEIITLYLYPPEKKCVCPDLATRPIQVFYMFL